MAEDRDSPLLQACELLHHTWGNIKPHACLVCGSGWGEIVEGLSPVSSIPYEQIHGMGRTTVEGHKGNLWLAKPKGKEVLIFQGRRHFYEGAGWKPVIFPVLLAHEMGIRSVVLTNAAGGISENLAAGDLMMIADHLNFMGNNPLIGEVPHPQIPRFPDQSKVYNPRLKDQIYHAAKAIGEDIKEGIYLALSGPTFETPAEIRAFAKLGADAVGMSTVPEAMVANGLGMKVAAISCISNLAAGRSAQALSHKDVQKTSEEVMPKMTSLLAHLIPALAEG